MADESPGAIIRRARQEARLTQAQLAVQLGVHKNTVMDWEKGKYFPDRHYHALNKILRITLGSPGDAEPEPPTISPGLLAAIRKELPPEDQQRVIDAVERTIRGEPQSSEHAESDRSSAPS